MDDTWFGERVFAVGDETFFWQDVVVAAHLWGDWAALEKNVRHTRLCVERLHGSPHAPSADVLEAAANEFRYERDLLSAEEMESWLQARRLTTDLWMEHILGLVSRQICADLGDAVEPGAAAPDADIERLLPIEAACGGWLDRWAETLAGRAAVVAAEQGRAAAQIASMPDETGHEALWRRVGLLPEAGRERLERFARGEAAFRGFCERLLTPGAIREQIVARHLDWIRLRGHKVAFPFEAMAREAVLCMKDDHRELRDVAADAGQRLDDMQPFLEEIDPDLQGRFLGARRGELIGPVPVGARFELYVIVEKVLPTIDDPEVRERAEGEILRRAIRREVDARVHWNRRTA